MYRGKIWTYFCVLSIILEGCSKNDQGPFMLPSFDIWHTMPISYILVICTIWLYALSKVLPLKAYNSRPISLKNILFLHVFFVEFIVLHLFIYCMWPLISWSSVVWAIISVPTALLAHAALPSYLCHLCFAFPAIMLCRFFLCSGVVWLCHMYSVVFLCCWYTAVCVVWHWAVRVNSLGLTLLVPVPLSVSILLACMPMMHHAIDKGSRPSI